MIIKIWDIHHGSNEKGVSRVLDYICDEAKTHDASHEPEPNATRNALEYINNEKKIDHQYISGHLCNPEMAEDEFRVLAEDAAAANGRTLSDGDIACYHIVQSLEKGIEVDPEEMHQMGRELLERIENGKYPAVIATHCQPVYNEEDGTWHGEQLHNHIIMSAYNAETKHKYHDCKDTYRELQRINDEIALEHGLPVITRPQKSRNKQQWYDFVIKNAKDYEDWKTKIKGDILAAREKNTTWDGYLTTLQQKGYKIHEGRYTTYEADPEHRIRDVRLGSEFEKDAIKAYFDEKQALIDDLRNPALDDRYFQMSINKSSLLSKPDDPMLVFEVPGTKGEKRINIPKDALIEKDSSYIFKFKGDIRIQFNDQEGSLDELMKYYMVKRAAQKQETYSQPNRYHPSTHKPYKTSVIGHGYRRKSVLQMSMELATLALTDASELFGSQHKTIQKTHTDRKLQTTIDALTLFYRHNIQSSEDIEKQLMNAGINLGRCKKTVLSLQASIESRRQILANIQKFRDIQDDAERIADKMAKGNEQISKEESVILRQYKNLSAYLHSKKVFSFEQQQDFEDRLKDTTEKYEAKKEELQNLIGNYIKWRKLKDVVSQYDEDDFPYNGEPMKTTDETREDPTEDAEKTTEELPAPGQENVPEKPVDR